MAIYKKRDDWYIDYYVDGRRRREKVGPSKSLAKEVLSKRLAELAERRFFPERQAAARPVLFRDFMEKYWERHWGRLRGKGGVYIKRDLLAAFGAKPLERITAGALQDYYNAKRDKTSAATANRHIARLGHVFNSARKWKDFAGPNPADDVEKEREENHMTRFLSQEEIAKLLPVCGPRIQPVVVCAIHTGMRRGEILGLRWENVDLEVGVIYVLQSKSGKSREVPLTPQLTSVLRALGPRTEGRVFDLSEITLKRHFQRALRRAGVANCRFHDLRHTFASHFAMTAGDLLALQRILGHSSIKMTQRYAHLSKAHLAREMKAFAEGLPLPLPASV